MGRSGDIFTITELEANSLIADDSLNTVIFIHRQDDSQNSGSEYLLRYDYSTDGGASFTSNIGPLNPNLTVNTAYPQAALFNPAGNTTPSNAKLIWLAGGLGSQLPDGHIAGACSLGSSTSSEHYNFTGGKADLYPMGFCQGKHGEYWAVSSKLTPSFNGIDSVYVFKGTYSSSSQDVQWSIQTQKFANNFKAWNNGNPIYYGMNAAFSPKGDTGWVAWLGDLNGGHDSLLSPIFMRSTNGGTTWGNPVEIDLRQFAWIKDTLTSFWMDGNGNPLGTGRPTTGFDCDLVVDVYGNPHLITVIGNGTLSGNQNPPQYSIFSAHEKFMADITSTDGGQTWEVVYLAPVLTFRGEFGKPDAQGDRLYMDNCPQISRNRKGTHIFYGWVDSDTILIGFGEQRNMAPNFITTAYRVTDGYRTCFRNITASDCLLLK
ncbi:MAG: hypothetical protein H6581_07205 [Bacteroidia bacterium]|nr:hypothetical protein [Bacteroidia bacterium]